MEGIEYQQKIFRFLIKEIRKNKKLTQKELGEILNLKDLTIRRYETGITKISFKFIFLLVKKLNIDELEFLNIILSDSFNEKLRENKLLDARLTAEIYIDLIKNIFDDDNLKHEKILDIFNGAINSLNDYSKLLEKNEIKKFLRDLLFFYFSQTEKNKTEREIQNLVGQVIKYIDFLQN